MGSKAVSWAAATRAAAAMALVTAGALAACGGSGDGGNGGNGGHPSVDDAAARTAATVCRVLRDWNNDLTDVFNATSQAITDADDPTTANGVLLDGFDGMIARAEAHVAESGDLELPDVPGRDRLVAELRAGAEESLAVLRDERGEAAELPPIDVDGQGGALGGASVAVERATSVLEPRIGAYDETLQRAFAADDGCAHVVQPAG